jgi:hypothetical protein
VANAALLKAAQEQQNQAVNQDLVKRIDPRQGQKNQVTVMHLPSAVLNAVKARTDVRADLVVIVAKEELLQNAPTPNVVMTEENQETDVHQLARTENVQMEEVTKDVQVDLVMKVATDVHQLVLTANALKVATMIDVRTDLVEIAAIEGHLQIVPIPNAVMTEENQETDVHQLALMAKEQKVEVKTDAQADLEVIEEIEDHQLVEEVTIEAAALIEKKTTTADQRVQPENLVVRTWLKELKLAI